MVNTATYGMCFYSFDCDSDLSGVRRLSPNLEEKDVVPPEAPGANVTFEPEGVRARPGVVCE